MSIVTYSAITERDPSLAQYKPFGFGDSCDHEDAVLSVLVAEGTGTFQYKFACASCYRSGGAIAYRLLTEEEKAAAVPRAELVALGKRKDERSVAVVQSIWSRLRDDPRYLAYLASPEWAEIRKRVMDREGGWCEGCQASPARDVHHMSYAHLYAEFLHELVALCRNCHKRWHRIGEHESAA